MIAIVVIFVQVEHGDGEVCLTKLMAAIECDVVINFGFLHMHCPRADDSDNAFVNHLKKTKINKYRRYNADKKSRQCRKLRELPDYLNF